MDSNLFNCDHSDLRLCCTHATSNSNTMGCPPVRGDNPRALACGLSYVQVDKHGITILYHLHQCRPYTSHRERSGSVVECLTRDQRAAGSSLTGVTALWSLSKTHLS